MIRRRALGPILALALATSLPGLPASARESSKATPRGASLKTERKPSPARPAVRGPASTKILSVRAWRASTLGREEMTVVFLPDAVELVVNSNFHSKRSNKTILGRMRAGKPARLESMRPVFESMEERLEKNEQYLTSVKAPEEGAVPPLQIQYEVSGHRVGADSPYLKDVEGFLIRVWALTDWRPMDAALLELGEDLKVSQTIVRNGKLASPRPSTFSPQSLNCRRVSHDGLQCQIPTYGTAYLARSGQSKLK